MKKLSLIYALLFGALFTLVVFGGAVNTFGQVCKGDPEVARQRKIISRLDAASKVELWRGHLLDRLRSRNYTKEQAKLIMKGYELINEARYINDPKRVAKEQTNPNGVLARWNKEVQSHFSPEENLVTFNKIDSVWFNEFIAAKPTFTQVFFREGGTCRCMSGGGECLGTGMSCEIGFPGFCDQNIGCGGLGILQCTGKCTPFGSD